MSDPYSEALLEAANLKLFAAEDEADRWRAEAGEWRRIADALASGAQLMVLTLNELVANPTRVRELVSTFPNVPPLPSLGALTKQTAGGDA